MILTDELLSARDTLTETEAAESREPSAAGEATPAIRLSHCS